jgi:stage II sporulation protein R
VLDIVSPAVSGCQTQAEAISAIGGIMGEINAVAREVILNEGYDYPVTVEIGEEYYPTTSYESCAFPEGRYASLRICIGEAEGKNWWCCLFPPLCLSAVTEAAEEKNEDAFIAVGLTSEQYKLITENRSPKYKIRFKILEAIQSIFN